MASNLKNLSDFSHTTVPSGQAFKFGIIVASWNAQVTGALYKGAYNSLLKHQVLEENIISVEVAGSYELIAGADLMLAKKQVDAVICLGCVIQGETKHFDFICDAVANGLANVGLKHTKPVIFGVLTTDNLNQALDRAGGKHGNKGDEAAITAIKMADLNTSLS
ncbi:6,7-dimethyl-8-ribityllumazine synthase [Pelobium manganitolerans]|uniref:6,7-dimethyl-8-ribityllumazine synthase n=1 Tax=Pelobium manganitolerans TaxID=1842495 RepID=UPI003FA3A999